jgi:hypothetical protein
MMLEACFFVCATAAGIGCTATLFVRVFHELACSACINCSAGQFAATFNDIC